MKHRLLYTNIFVSLALLLACCAGDDGNDMRSVTGKWKGTSLTADISVSGLPAPFSESDDEFDAAVEFKEDGNVTISDNGRSSTGTWSQNGDQLDVTSTFDTPYFDLSGRYTIKEITDARLTLYIEKATTYTEPESGAHVEGIVKATLHFAKQ